MTATKSFKGKAIYQPKGKAAEYAAWACNFYVGCSNNCSYCYCKKGILAGTMGQNKPQLKKCFKDKIHAFNLFMIELDVNLVQLQKCGLFFSFTTDPMLYEELDLTLDSAMNATMHDVPVKILTKRADWVDEFLRYFSRYEVDLYYLYHKDNSLESKKHLWVFGFTLTGHDELEPGANTNQERIEAMKKLHNAGFKTFASIEPVINTEISYSMIEQTIGFCDLYKVGLLSGAKYDKKALKWFVLKTMSLVRCNHGRLYFKDSLVSAIGATREDMKLWQWGGCLVDRDYNIFNCCACGVEETTGCIEDDNKVMCCNICGKEVR